MTAHPCEPLTAVTVPPAPIKAKILGRTSVTVRRVFWYATRAKSTSPPGGKLWSGAAFPPAEDCCSFIEPPAKKVDVLTPLCSGATVGGSLPWQAQHQAVPHSS